MGGVTNTNQYHFTFDEKELKEFEKQIQIKNEIGKKNSNGKKNQNQKDNMEVEMTS